MIYDREKVARWRGRHASKDSLRESIWNAIDARAIGIGPVWGRIPNFVGADSAAKRLSDQPFWKEARVVKCNADPAQTPVRLHALYGGKLLYVVANEPTNGLPVMLLDPAELRKKNISFEFAATAEGALAHGKAVTFEEVQALDVIVVGCVAVTLAGGRTGKGGGLEDMDLSVLHELGKVPAHARVVTTVHDMQIVEDDCIEMLPHDAALHCIATPWHVIEAGFHYMPASGISWGAVHDEPIRDVPFMASLKKRIFNGKGNRL